ncbi:hypothetical protein H3H36_15625 [Duganella sp. FT3S]|uniref:Uncharacterized protein n=1 Tax=Rugamonas fusca TaxID=2758568 RepID=A0A7W2I7R7_9BURK|nr:hypothetical protein [Rugamonas fusca]MBA5606786.1 hypothetical protein [Rugamonas fusca]
MQSKVDKGIAMPEPIIKASRISKANVKNLSANVSQKTRPMSEGSRRGRLSAIATRTRTMFGRAIAESIAPLFSSMDGEVRFWFPGDGTSYGSIGAWLTEGDLVYTPANKVQASNATDLWVDQSVLIAKFRMTPEHEIRAVREADSKEFPYGVYYVGNMLTSILREIELENGQFLFPPPPQPIERTDEAYAAFKDARAVVFKTSTWAMMNETVSTAKADEAARKKVNNKLSAQDSALKFFFSIMNEACSAMPDVFSASTIEALKADIHRNMPLLQGEIFQL